jgi:small-conductance mechanosensitive channel
MDNKWLLAAIAVAAGFILAGMISRIVASWLGNEKRPEALREVAAPLVTLVFWGIVVTGLLVALGFVDSQALDQLPKDLVAYIPRVIAAAILFIVGNVIASLAETAVARALSRAPGSAKVTVPRAVRYVVLSLAGILSVSQLGIDTTILNMLVAAVLFALSLGFALLLGFGARGVGGQVAAGRAVRKLIAVGDSIQLSSVSGAVVELHAVAVELVDTEGQVHLVPNEVLVHDFVRIDRGEG